MREEFKLMGPPILFLMRSSQIPKKGMSKRKRQKKKEKMESKFREGSESEVGDKEM